MKNYTQLECAWYGDLAQRIEKRDEWKLYICDHFWVLDIDAHYEFYFHPLHFLGKVESKQLPESSFQYLRNKCKCFTEEDRKSDNEAHFYATLLVPSRYRLQVLRKRLAVGNWFYA